MDSQLPQGQSKRHRLGFSIRVYGAPDLPSHDARGPAGAGHLSVNLAYLRDILLYLQTNRIGLYRMHSYIIPRALHDDPELLSSQLDECKAQTDLLAGMVAASGLRLTFHPYSLVVLNSPSEESVQRAVNSLTAHTGLLDALRLGPEGVVVLHVGGIHDDLPAARERFVRAYEALPPGIQRRVALEQDDGRFGYRDVQWIHERCGVPLVFDNLHHQVWNSDGVPEHAALAHALSTWPSGVRPKVHYCTPRSEMREIPGSGRIKVPTWKEHGDFVVPFQFIDWMRGTEGLPAFDIMLEAKARDMALLKLRQDLAQYGPDVARRID